MYGVLAASGGADRVDELDTAVENKVEEMLAQVKSAETELDQVFETCVISLAAIKASEELNEL